MAVEFDQILTALGVPRGRTPPIDRLVEDFGGGSRGRSRLAIEISGSSDKKSKEYKAAMRNLQRYAAGAGKQQRRPKQMQTKLRGAWQKEQVRRTINELRGKTVRVSIIAPTIHVSGDWRQRNTTISEEITPQEWEAFANLAESSSQQEAVDALMGAVMDAYGISGASVEGVGDLTIRGE
jgi:hypothetical protein